MPQRNSLTGEGVPSQAELKWIDTTGGPHVLMPQEGLAGWKGVENWADNSEGDPSDYARACRNGTNWLNLIGSAKYVTAVFGGDVGPVAWLGKSATSGTFVQWIGCDDDAAVLNLLAQDELGTVERRKCEEKFLLETGPSGRMVLLDASKSGIDIGEDDREIVSLMPGRYQMTAYYLETDACMIVVRALSRCEQR